MNIEISSDKKRIPTRDVVRLENTALYTTTLKEDIGMDEDFTVLVRMMATTDQPQHIICSNVFSDEPFNYAMCMLYNQNGDFYTIYPCGRPYPSINTTYQPELNVWHNCVVTRKDKVLYLFLDGKLIGTSSDRMNGISDKRLATSIRERISYATTTTTRFEKYYDEILVIKNQALWTKNFNPDTGLTQKIDSIRLY